MAGKEPLFFERAEYIAGYADDKCFLRQLLQHSVCFATAAAGQVMAVHRFGEVPIAVGIKPFYQFIALVIDIGRRFIIVELFFVAIGLVLYHDAIIPVGEQANATGRG